MVFSWHRFRHGVATVLHLDEEPSRIAAGMAVGVFIGITPFYGLHTLLALVVAFICRLNKAATITGAWTNLPWFAPFVYAFCFKLGETILSGNLSASWFTPTGLAEGAAVYLYASPSEHVWAFWQGLWTMMFTASKPLFVGTTVVGTALAVPTYFLALGAVREIRRLQRRARVTRLPSHSPRTPEEPRP